MAETKDIHRIGGGRVENLRLKPKDAKLKPPGISVLKATTPADARRQLREALPEATNMHAAAKIIGSSTIEKIRSTGFDVMPNPSRKLPSHYRIIHPEGVAGFNDENLKKLAQVFTDTSEPQS